MDGGLRVNLNAKVFWTKYKQKSINTIYVFFVNTFFHKYLKDSKFISKQHKKYFFFEA